ncbi:MAG: leucine--tRNA ligase [Minisyncoccia bacterium]
MHKKFNHEAIEKKWQKVWKDSHIYDVGERDHTKEKEYVLVEWPYPSGNLHVGHWFAFAIVDIYVRARRMQGKQVLFPIGFDAFGLPAENAAIKHKLDPKKWTESNIVYMREQLESMGNAFSWDTSVSSTDLEYYKWTQWMFTQFFERDIAYRGFGIVNWCPGCNTVIANEQVEANNTCSRSGDIVEKKQMQQWMLRITQYADRLVDDLETLDWPHHIKEAQRQWIGRSEGALVDFKLSTGDVLPIFTTRADTLYGATYVVLAPDHELVAKNSSVIANWSEVEAYAKEASQKDEMLRTKAEKEKTGVCLQGITATNPATGKEIPVYIGDYVLKGYGTGAIMAVPAHDDRDFAFATKFNLPITQVIAGDEALPFARSGILINSSEFDGMDSELAKETILKKVHGEKKSTYRLRDWSIGRQRYWGVPIPIVYDPEGKAHVVPKEHLPWKLPTDVDFTPTGTAPLAKSAELKKRVEDIFGKGWTPEVETMDTFVDSSWYFLRYFDRANENCFSSLEKQKEWMPIDTYFGGAEHTTMHLLYSRFWQKVLFDLGLVTVNEPFSKRVNRGLVLGTDGNKMSKSKGNVIDPDQEVKRFGADTVKMYLSFMGPYGELSNYPWDVGGIVGLRRFLERVYGFSEHIKENETEETTKLLHKTISKVETDISSYKFNTAISALMIFVNHVEKNGMTRETYCIFLQLIAPFAPHMSDELWSEIGEEGSIHKTKWPATNAELLKGDTVTISVQINGKMRGTIVCQNDISEDEVLLIIKSKEELQDKLKGQLKKVFFVQNKIINLIIDPSP